jgi:hypothetical protein
VHARFTVKQHCANCPLWTQCRPPDGKPTSHRTVFISDYHHQLRAAVPFNASGEGQALLATRWRVEPVVSWLVQYQGCRRARRVGQPGEELPQCAQVGINGTRRFAVQSGCVGSQPIVGG